MEFQHKVLENATLRPSSQGYDGLSWAEIAAIANYKIEYIKWELGTSYRDHVHLDTEYIYIIAGDLSDGDATFRQRTLLTYPPGSAHNNLRTEAGAEFILIWTGKERVNYL